MTTWAVTMRGTMALVTALVLCAVCACKPHDSDPSGLSGPPLPDASTLPVRTFRMGFSPLPPRATDQAVQAALAAWTSGGHADAAILHQSVPWRALLSGTSATAAVTANELPAANYFRAKNLTVFVTVDVTDGLNRAAEAPELVALGRSITERAVQQLYRDYVRALVTLVRPSYLGLAAETNLIRASAPGPVYAAVVGMTNDAATDVRALSGTLPTLYVSVQAEVAWGGLSAGSSVYQGVETDFRDFPFVQALGISSYPYFRYTEPDAIPADYYRRLPSGRSMPLLVVEGGWTSVSIGSLQSSPEKQARYLRRQEMLLDSARAVAAFQLSFTDLDPASFGGGATLALFTRIGLVDTELRPKASLATWDSVFARRLAR